MILSLCYHDTLERLDSAIAFLFAAMQSNLFQLVTLAAATAAAARRRMQLLLYCCACCCVVCVLCCGLLVAVRVYIVAFPHAVSMLRVVSIEYIYIHHHAPCTHITSTATYNTHGKLDKAHKGAVFLIGNLTKMGVGNPPKCRWESHQNAGEKPTGNFIWDSHENFHGNPAISF